MSDEQLAHALDHADFNDTEHITALSREADRRDKADKDQARTEATKAKAAARRRDEHDDWYVAAQGQYLAAEEETRGHMLSKAGEHAGVREIDLWGMNERTARKYASEELNEWWDTHPRITQATARKEARKSAFVEREAYEAEHGPYSSIYAPPAEEEGWSAMRRQDFDKSEPLSLLDDSTVRAAQPMKPAKDDAAGTPDMFA